MRWPFACTCVNGHVTKIGGLCMAGARMREVGMVAWPCSWSVLPARSCAQAQAAGAPPPRCTVRVVLGGGVAGRRASCTAVVAQAVGE